jgi:hypothetical protein
MPDPLDYEASPQPSRASAVLFWFLYAAGGFCAAYTTDTVLHIGRRPSDGGGFMIGLWSLIPFAALLLVILRFVARQKAPPAWTGALIGILVPPIALTLVGIVLPPIAIGALIATNPI